MRKVDLDQAPDALASNPAQQPTHKEN